HLPAPAWLRLHSPLSPYTALFRSIFRVLTRSLVAHSPAIANFPEVVNQTVRLELLNLLAILEYPGAQEAMKRFFKQRPWGVTGRSEEHTSELHSRFDIVRRLLLAE